MPQKESLGVHDRSTVMWRETSEMSSDTAACLNSPQRLVSHYRWRKLGKVLADMKCALDSSNLIIVIRDGSHVFLSVHTAFYVAQMASERSKGSYIDLKIIRRQVE